MPAKVHQVKVSQDDELIPYNFIHETRKKTLVLVAVKWLKILYVQD